MDKIKNIVFSTGQNTVKRDSDLNALNSHIIQILQCITRRHMNKTYDHNTFNYDNVVTPKLTVVIFHWFSCAFRYVYTR